MLVIVTKLQIEMGIHCVLEKCSWFSKRLLLLCLLHVLSRLFWFLSSPCHCPCMNNSSHRDGTDSFTTLCNGLILIYIFKKKNLEDKKCGKMYAFFSTKKFECLEDQGTSCQ